MYMKKELLAPAGNMACLKQAVHNGADAVYLAGKLYGARKFANNFTNEELVDAVKYAHLYDVKVYVTVNTIIYEEEMNLCLEYVAFLYNIGVDAVIVQDMGLIKIIRELLPEMEIHASTQAHTHNLEQIKLLETLGVKRVVLAREMSITEINNLDTNMELEIFIHGALCISYSGQCLFSSGVLNRSGNRGECAGLCRTPFDVLDKEKCVVKNKYVLSPKEFCSVDYGEELKNCKAYSLKIEGRMKSPEYVGYVTSIYRKILDNENCKLSEEEIFNLKSLYNRGFTKGYLFLNSDKEFISFNSSNHQGVEIGEVVEVNDKKIKIKLSHDLHQEDAIRLPNNEGMFVNFLYNAKMNLINKALKNDIVYVDNKVGLKSLGPVKLTVNKTLAKTMANLEYKKIKIRGYVKAVVNEPLMVKYSDGKNEVSFVGDKVLNANSAPITEERIKEVMAKLGNTPFVLDEWDSLISENIFISIGVLNNIRRLLIEDLINKRTTVNRSVKVNLVKGQFSKNNVNKLKISALARTEEQIKALILNEVDYIYVTSESLYKKYKSDNVYLRLDRVLSKHEERKNDNLLIGETGSLCYVKNNVIVTDYYLNVVNNSYIEFLKNRGVKRVTISPECSIEKLKSLTVSDIDLEIIIYGTIEYMILKYNLLDNMQLNNCSLEDKSKRRFAVIKDKFTHIMSDKPIDLIYEIEKIKNTEVAVLRLELLNENASEIEKIINLIKKKI